LLEGVVARSTVAVGTTLAVRPERVMGIRSRGVWVFQYPVRIEEGSAQVGFAVGHDEI
jgi:hypothetical protein